MPPDAGTTNSGTASTIGQCGRGNPRTGDIRHVGDINGPSDLGLGLSLNLADVTVSSSKTYTTAGAISFSKLKPGMKVTISGCRFATNNGVKTVVSVTVAGTVLTVAETCVNETVDLVLGPFTDLTFTAATKTIATAGGSFAGINIGDKIVITGCTTQAGNNKTVTVVTNADSKTMTVAETLTDDTEAGSVTLTDNAISPNLLSNSGGTQFTTTPGTNSFSIGPEATDDRWNLGGTVAFAFDGGSAFNGASSAYCGADASGEGFDGYSGKKGMEN